MLRWIRSYFSDKPIGHMSREEERFGKTFDGRWVDTENDDEYGTWMIVRPAHTASE